jgi:hypothetical protein
MKRILLHRKSWTYWHSLFLLSLVYLVAAFLVGPYADSESHQSNALLNWNLIQGEKVISSPEILVLSREYSFTLFYISIFPMWIVSILFDFDLDLNSANAVIYRNSIVSIFGLILVFVSTHVVKNLVRSKMFRTSPLTVVFFPTLMGHSWFNEKDMPISVGVALLIFASFQLLELAPATGSRVTFLLYFSIILFSIGVRPALGIIVFPFLLLVITLLIKLKKREILIAVATSSILATTLVFFTNKPFQEEGIFWFLNSVRVSGAYPWTGAVEVWSNFYRAPLIPGHYLLQVFLSQLPILIVLLMIVNFKYLITTNAPENLAQKSRLAFIGISVPVLVFVAAVVLQPILYDDGRQLLFLWVFVFISFLLLLDNFIEVHLDSDNPGSRNRLSVICFLILVSLSVLDSVKLFPYNYVYRNEIASASGLAFETDYWGVSGKELSSWVLNDSKRQKTRPISFGYIFPQSFDPYIKNTTIVRLPYNDPKVDYYGQIFRPPLLPDQSSNCPIVFSAKRETILGKEMTLGYIRSCL